MVMTRERAVVPTMGGRAIVATRGGRAIASIMGGRATGIGGVGNDYRFYSTHLGERKGV